MPDNFGRMTSDEAPQSLKDFCFPKQEQKEESIHKHTPGPETNVGKCTFGKANYRKVITRMHADICRLIEEKAEIEACVEELIAIRDQARAVHATGCGTYNDKRTSVDRKKLSDLGLMVKESYKTIPSEFNGSEAEVDVKTTTG